MTRIAVPRLPGGIGRHMAALLLFTGACAPLAAQTPIRVEAESFVNYGGGAAVSLTGGSSGVGIDADATTVSLRDNQTLSGGQSIGFFSTFSQEGAAEYVEYDLQVPEDGLYSVKVRQAFAPVTVTLRFWNLTWGTIIDETFDLNDTNSGWYTPDYQNSIDMPNPIPMKAGTSRLRLYVTQGGTNIDYFEFTRTGPLAGLGVVQGGVTAGGQPISRVQVSAPVTSVAVPGTPDLLGFRAVTNDQGAYKLLLPAGSQTVTATANGYNDPAAAGASATVTVPGSGTVSQNFTLTPNGKYEAEWFTAAYQNTSANPDGRGFGTYDVDGASQGQVIGNLEHTFQYMDFRVNVPAASSYDVRLQYASNEDTTMRVSVPASGAVLEETVPGSGGENTYVEHAFLGKLPLAAGENTVRIENRVEGRRIFPDYLVISRTTQVATITGTVTNTSSGQPAQGVTITASSLDGSTAAITDAQGKYTLRLAPGTYTITPSHEGYAGSDSQEVTVASGETKTADFNIRLDLIQGRVLDQAGQPYAGLLVRAYNAIGEKLREVTTDAEGRYAIGVPPEAVHVVTSAPLTIPVDLAVDVSGTVTRDIVLQKVAGGTPVPLTFTEDFFSDHIENPGDTSTVHLGSSLPGEVMPPAGPFTLDGVDFLAPDPAGTANNVVPLMTNPVIDIPDGRYAALVILGTGSGLASEVIRGDVTITYSDNSTGSGSFLLADWYWGTLGTSVWKPLTPDAWIAFDMGHYHADNTPVPEGDSGLSIYLYSVVVPMDPTKTATQVAVTGTYPSVYPDSEAFLYAMTLANPAAVPFVRTRQALRIAAGLAAAPTASSAEFTSLNAVDTAASAGRIDLLDAVALARQGQ